MRRRRRASDQQILNTKLVLVSDPAIDGPGREPIDGLAGLPWAQHLGPTRPTSGFRLLGVWSPGRRRGTRVAAALDQVKRLAERRGIDATGAASGFKVTAPIKGAEAYTELPVFSDWQIASGFTHARPWAHHGFLRREKLETLDSGHSVYRLTPREPWTLYLPVQALHLLGEVMRLRDRRAGLSMAPLPDGLPDGEPPTRRN